MKEGFTSRLKWDSNRPLDKFGELRSSLSRAAHQNMDLMHLLKVAGGIIVGNMLFERFLLKNPVDNTGFIEVKEGFGMDDVVRAATVAAVVIAAEKFLPGKKA